MRMERRLAAQKIQPRQSGKNTLKWLLFISGIAATACGYMFYPSSQNSQMEVSAKEPLPDVRWNQLVSELESSAKNFRGDIGILIKDLNGNREWSYQPDRLFPSASLIKVPIMAATFHKIKEGGLQLDTPLQLTRKDRMSGSGRLKWQRAGATFTVRDLLFYMITESDNTAMRTLLNYSGLAFYQQQFKEMGLLVTNIEEQGLKLSSRPVLRENYTTAREMGDMLTQIYKGKMVNKDASDTMLEMLKSLKHRERLARTLPPGWQIAHKTGLLRRACHDAGIIYSPEGNYVLVVLTWKGPDYRSSKNYISKIGKITYRYFQGDSDLALADSPRRGI